MTVQNMEKYGLLVQSMSHESEIEIYSIIVIKNTLSIEFMSCLCKLNESNVIYLAQLATCNWN